MAKTIFDLRDYILSKVGDVNCYIQPPGDERMKYPCIVIDRNPGRAVNADNTKYIYDKSYSLTYIYYDIDDPVVDSLMELQYCSLDRHFKADNLYHSAFTIFY